MSSEKKTPKAVFDACNIILEKKKRNVRVIVNELTEAQSDVVEASENLLKAKEALELFYNTEQVEDSLEVERNLDIQEYSKRLPACMEKIKNEDPIPFKYILELGD